MRNVHPPTAKTKRRTILFFEIGMILALSITLWAFNYSSYAPEILVDMYTNNEDDGITEMGSFVIEPDEPAHKDAKTESLRPSDHFEIVPDIIPLPDPGIIIPSPEPIGTIQVNVAKEPDPATIIENPVNWASQMPQFPGGEDAMRAFILKELNYPPLAIENGISGRVMVSFVVEKDGSLSDIQIVHSVGWGIDEEAKRVVAMMPNWLPGENNYRAVRVRVYLPVKFQFR